MIIMNPHIEILPFPINILNKDEGHELYHVLVSQGKIKMLFLVTRVYNSKRDFEVVRCEYLTLHGINERDKYLGKVNNLSLSADTTIVNSIFESSLKPFGIELLEVTFHDYEFFESNKENKGFIFRDLYIYNSLKDLINKRCKIMMINQNILQI